MNFEKNDELESANVDERFIDALVRHALRPDPEARRLRVENAMNQINTKFSRRAVFEGRFARYAVAASLLILVGLVWALVDDTNTAHAMVARCIEVSRAAGPRHYEVTLEYKIPLIGGGKIEAELYVDGEERYAVRKSSNRGGRELWFGRNGNSFWTVPPEGRQTFSDRRMLQNWVAKRENMDSELLLVDSVLERLVHDFELAVLDDELLSNPMLDDQLTYYGRVRGKLREKSTDLPMQIDVWVDRESGVARKLVLDWVNSEGNRRLTKTSIELMPTPDLPENWFEAEGH